MLTSSVRDSAACIPRVEKVGGLSNDHPSAAPAQPVGNRSAPDWRPGRAAGPPATAGRRALGERDVQPGIGDAGGQHFQAQPIGLVAHPTESGSVGEYFPSL
jgi:hypothetical protein